MPSSGKIRDYGIADIAKSATLMGRRRATGKFRNLGLSEGESEGEVEVEGAESDGGVSDVEGEEEERREEEKDQLGLRLRDKPSARLDWTGLRLGTGG